MESFENTILKNKTPQVESTVAKRKRSSSKINSQMVSCSNVQHLFDHHPHLDNFNQIQKYFSLCSSEEQNQYIFELMCKVFQNAQQTQKFERWTKLFNHWIDSNRCQDCSDIKNLCLCKKLNTDNAS